MRFLVRGPGGTQQQDLAAALTLFEPVYQASPDSVPDQVRVYFEASSPRASAFRAAALLQEALRAGDIGALDDAVDLLHRAVAATPTVPRCCPT